MKKITDYNRFFLLNPYSNQEVTSVYCGIICDSLRKLGISVEQVSTIKKDKANKKCGIIVVRTGDAWKAKRYKFGYIITWIQGVAPEETWLSLKRPSRYLFVLLLEILGLLSSDFNFYCSERMKKHYKKRFIVKAKLDYVMPCFNEEIDIDAFKKKNYSENIFIFAGGMDKWQCFHRTAEIYKKIEDKLPNCLFKVFARDKDLAKKEIDSLGIRNYLIDYVTPQELKNEFITAKFGFCIRDDIEINRVATPTKLSNYVSAGLIPIYSKCLDGFYRQSKNNKYSLCENDKDFFARLEELCLNKIDNNDLMNEFLTCYENYYSSSFHISKITELIEKYEK